MLVETVHDDKTSVDSILAEYEIWSTTWTCGTSVRACAASSEMIL
jgi:hypothetical protein